jgi:hypothetical protein
MPSPKRPPANDRTKAEVRALKRENKELRKKLKEAEEQRRQAIQAWARTQFTEKDVRRWEREFRKGKGGSLLALIQELEPKVR